MPIQLTGPTCPPPCGTEFKKRDEWCRGDTARCPACGRVAEYIAPGLYAFRVHGGAIRFRGNLAMLGGQ